MTAFIEKTYPFPLYLTVKENMTHEEFFDFCAANKHLRIERDEDKQIIIMAPTGGETGNTHSEINFAVQLWNKQTHSGKTFDSSTGFILPDGSMRSPDVAWITQEKWDRLSREARKRFLPFAPDFLVEVLSPTDHLQPAQEKMHKWIQNGTRLAWLIVQTQSLSFIYRANGTTDKVEGFDKNFSAKMYYQGLNLISLFCYDELAKEHSCFTFC